jgi:hypothetical protein
VTNLVLYISEGGIVRRRGDVLEHQAGSDK